MPPINGLVEGTESTQSRPSWLKVAQRQARRRRRFLLPVETDKGRYYIVVVLSSTDTLRGRLREQASRSLRYTLILLLVTTLITGMLVFRFTRPSKICPRPRVWWLVAISVFG